MSYVKNQGKSIESSDDLSSGYISRGSLVSPFHILNIFW